MTLKNKLTYGITAVIISAVFLVFYLAGVQTKVVFGNPSVFTSIAKTATATTTLSYMTAGLATTTVYYDSMQVEGSNQTNNGNTWVTDSAVLKIQFTASSSLAIVNTFFEFADGINCGNIPTGCDWYRDNLYALPFATSTPTIQLAITPSYTWSFASSSQGGAGVGASNNRVLKVINVPTPTRWVRAILSVPVGASPASVYAEILPKKQVAI